MINLKDFRLFHAFLLLSCGALLCTNLAEAQLDSDGALAIWLLDEGKGVDVEDSSGNDNGGAFEQGQPEWVDGKFGKALEFDQQSWVAMNNPVVTVEGMVDFSIGCWANPGDSQKTWTNILSSHQEPPRRGVSFEMFEDQTNFFGIAFGDGENWIGGGWAQLKAGVWNHMAFVRTGNMGTWYLDGEQSMEVRLLSDNPVFPATSNFRIGNFVLGGREYNGAVDDAFLFERALSADEIKDIVDNGIAAALADTGTAVDPRDKASVTWGQIKTRK
ncbi:MAG: LamG domain-containing protein [Candidatus Poribacteria bacterium]|nr:LamG domain-containing protein [Candidatus Poribacteria bacterium]